MKVKVWTTDTEIWIEREDGTRGFERFADYPRLRDATQEERNAYEVLPYGLHWEALDEDSTRKSIPPYIVSSWSIQNSMLLPLLGV